MTCHRAARPLTFSRHFRLCVQPIFATASAIAMRGFFSKLLCLIAAVSLMDGHIVALQSFAWASMLHDRIPEQGVSEALATTFDGEHPCEHCLAALKLHGAESENPQPEESPPQLQLSGLKTTQIAQQRIALPAAPSATLLPHHFFIIRCASDFTSSVPTPPPRLG